MLKKMLSVWGVLSVFSLTSFADVYEIPDSGFTKYLISFDNAKKIGLTFDVTAEVDSCNHHGLIGDLMPISDGYYVAELSIMSTEMWCSDPSTRTQVFTKDFEVAGSYVTILVPTNAAVSAYVIE